MSLMVVGLSHKTAPVELREKLIFPPADIEKSLIHLKGNAPLNEMVILSTCNRTEIYGASGEETQSWYVRYLCEHYGRQNLETSLYTMKGKEMVEHLFKVSSGLDSMVLGENEILKQVKDAYQLAHKSGFTGKLLNVLFQRALYVGKLVRTHTAIGQGAVSVGSVAVSLAEKIFGDLSQSTVLILGAGKMAEISARHLLSKKIRRLIVANRTLDNARSLAEKFNGVAVSLEEGFNQLSIADVVITSATVTDPILSKRMLSDTMIKRRNRSLFLIDIAVPRNVEESAHEIDNVYLYDIDDLQSIIQGNMKSRSEEIKKADHIVVEKSEEFMEWYRSLESGEEKSFKHQSDFMEEISG